MAGSSLCVNARDLHVRPVRPLEVIPPETEKKLFRSYMNPKVSLSFPVLPLRFLKETADTEEERPLKQQLLQRALRSALSKGLLPPAACEGGGGGGSGERPDGAKPRHHRHNYRSRPASARHHVANARSAKATGSALQRPFSAKYGVRSSRVRSCRIRRSFPRPAEEDWVTSLVQGVLRDLDRRLHPRERLREALQELRRLAGWFIEVLPEALTYVSPLAAYNDVTQQLPTPRLITRLPPLESRRSVPPARPPRPSSPALPSRPSPYLPSQPATRTQRGARPESARHSPPCPSGQSLGERHQEKSPRRFTPSAKRQHTTLTGSSPASTPVRHIDAPWHCNPTTQFADENNKVEDSRTVASATPSPPVAETTLTEAKGKTGNYPVSLQLEMHKTEKDSPSRGDVNNYVGCEESRLGATFFSQSTLKGPVPSLLQLQPDPGKLHFMVEPGVCDSVKSGMTHAVTAVADTQAPKPLHVLGAVIVLTPSESSSDICPEIAGSQLIFSPARFVNAANTTSDGEPCNSITFELVSPVVESSDKFSSENADCVGLESGVSTTNGVTTEKIPNLDCPPQITIVTNIPDQFNSSGFQTSLNTTNKLSENGFLNVSTNSRKVCPSNCLESNVHRYSQKDISSNGHTSENSDDNKSGKDNSSFETLQQNNTKNKHGSNYFHGITKPKNSNISRTIKGVREYSENKSLAVNSVTPKLKCSSIAVNKMSRSNKTLSGSSKGSNHTSSKKQKHGKRPSPEKCNTPLSPKTSTLVYPRVILRSPIHVNLQEENNRTVQTYYHFSGEGGYSNCLSSSLSCIDTGSPDRLTIKTPRIHVPKLSVPLRMRRRRLSFTIPEISPLRGRPYKKIPSSPGHRRHKELRHLCSERELFVSNEDHNRTSFCRPSSSDLCISLSKTFVPVDQNTSFSTQTSKKYSRHLTSPLVINCPIAVKESYSSGHSTNYPTNFMSASFYKNSSACFSDKCTTTNHEQVSSSKQKHFSSTLATGGSLSQLPQCSLQLPYQSQTPYDSPHQSRPSSQQMPFNYNVNFSDESSHQPSSISTSHSTSCTCKRLVSSYQLKNEESTNSILSVDRKTFKLERMTDSGLENQKIINVTSSYVNIEEPLHTSSFHTTLKIPVNNSSCSSSDTPSSKSSELPVIGALENSKNRLEEVESQSESNEYETIMTIAAPLFGFDGMSEDSHLSTSNSNLSDFSVANEEFIDATEVIKSNSTLPAELCIVKPDFEESEAVKDLRSEEKISRTVSVPTSNLESLLPNENVFESNSEEKITPSLASSKVLDITVESSSDHSEFKVSVGVKGNAFMGVSSGAKTSKKCPRLVSGGKSLELLSLSPCEFEANALEKPSSTFTECFSYRNYDYSELVMCLNRHEELLRSSAAGRGIPCSIPTSRGQPQKAERNSYEDYIHSLRKHLVMLRLVCPSESKPVQCETVIQNILEGFSAKTLVTNLFSVSQDTVGF